MVKLAGLKAWAFRELRGKADCLRDIILNEPDTLTPEELLVEEKMWLRIFESERMIHRNDPYT